VSGEVSTRRVRRSGISRWQFFRRFLANYSIGALTPSSAAAARAMADQADLRAARTVVELGPGTGVVTRELLRRLPAGARLIAFETEPYFVAYLRAALRDPRFLLVPESAERMAERLEELAATPVDYVFSEIPLSSMPGSRASILAAARALLRDGGRLVVLQYSPFILRPLLRELFPRARTAAFVPWNLPPAFVLCGDTAEEAEQASAGLAAAALRRLVRPVGSPPIPRVGARVRVGLVVLAGVALAAVMARRRSARTAADWKRRP
jgi:phospholipid N-methyltransferase